MIPFPTGLKYKMFEVLGRFPPCDSFMDKPGNFFGPDWEDIEYDIAFVKRESGISGIECSEQPLGKRKHPEHLLPAGIGAITPSSF